MAKRAYELLVRFGQGESVAGAHVKEMNLDEQGNDIRETAPIPLADTDNPVFTAFADKFSAKTVAENEVLKAEKATLESEKASLTSQLASKTTEAESLAEDKATLQAEKTDFLAQVSTLTSEKSALTSQLAAKTEQAEGLAEDKANLQSEKADLLSEKADLASQVSMLTSEKTALESQVIRLEEQKAILAAEKAQLVADHRDEKSQLTDFYNAQKTELIATHNAEKATLNTALAAANARIVHLTNELPFNPREISLSGFMARLKQVLDPTEMIVLFAADTPDLILKEIATTITGWESKYPVRLDSQELQQPLGYLVSIEMLTPEEVVFLRKDCTRAEAYFVPEEK